MENKINNIKTPYQWSIDTDSSVSNINNLLKLEWRMFGLVPYNLSPIQQGIQFGHSCIEYSQSVLGLTGLEEIYNKWAREDKTFIILNGGTTNNNPDKLGSLNKHMQVIASNGIQVQPFYEPDLGDQLTAFVFLVDERVFNRELYQDFVKEIPSDDSSRSENYPFNLELINDKNYESWVNKIGGPKNVFLRDYLKPLKLA
jgi:hypothetical protein